MAEKKVKLEKGKRKFSLHRLMADKKKRYLVMLAMMIPFIVGIIIFGSVAYREGKTLLDLAKGGQVETKPDNIVESMNYILRDNPTDIQKEYFKELKTAIEEGTVKTEEGEVPADDVAIASLVAKNYITDFYTWTNKRGQYDIGGFYYIYEGEFQNGDHYKENLYLKARDGFYKYISAYGTKYGKENLIEVENVDIVSCKKMDSKYLISEHESYKQDENGEWYDYRVDKPYDWYLVQCRWTYKENTVLPMSQFATSVNLAIINRDGRYEIVEASEKTINAGKGSQQQENSSTDQTSENIE